MYYELMIVYRMEDHDNSCRCYASVFSYALHLTDRFQLDTVHIICPVTDTTSHVLLLQLKIYVISCHYHVPALGLVSIYIPWPCLTTLPESARSLPGQG